MADFIVFGEDWGGHPSSTQHLIKHLLKSHRVIWINSIGMRSPKLRFRDLKRLTEKALLIVKKQGDRINNDKLAKPIIINPKIIPFYGITLIRKINKYLLTKQIQKACEDNQFKRVVLWTSLPTAVDVFGEIGEILSIYYCGDDFSALEGVDHSTVESLEQELIKKVDVTLVASTKLSEKFSDTKTILLPHGVDFELFSGSRRENYKASSLIAGFYGSISNWLDIDKLTQAATALPNWKFVFIGDIKIPVESLKALPNVKFIDSVPHNELPEYIKNWDVALLPFRLNKQIESCNPLKLREYLASGVAIASTNFPAVHEYSDYVSIQKNRELFSVAILRAYKDRDSYQGRINSVKDGSWSNRAFQLENLITHLTSSK